MATGPEHYAEAERLRAAADEWADADTGWKAELTAQERINQRLANLADAQVHATLALAAAVGTFGGDEARSREDFMEWERVAGEYTRQAPIRAAADANERAEEQAARDAEAAENTGPHHGRPNCEGCPACIGYTDPDEPDDETTAPDLVGAMDRHSSSHGTAAVYDRADPHDAALAEQSRAEHVDYAEAEAVREIEREMDRQAGDDSEIDRQVAEDDARAERYYEENEDEDGGEGE